MFDHLIEHDEEFSVNLCLHRTLAANSKSQGCKKSLTQEINRLDCLSIIFYICLLIAIKKLDDHSCEFSLSPLNSTEWTNEDEDENEREEKWNHNNNKIMHFYYPVLSNCECVRVCLLLISLAFTQILPVN